MAEKSQRRIITQASGPTGGSILFDNPDCREIFVEGVGEMAFGPAMTKVRFFNIKTVDTSSGLPQEEREITLSLVIPTSALLEFTASLNHNLTPYIDLVETASKASIAALRQAAGKTIK